MRKNGIIIAIDGPAGVGKSSVGRDVASEIGYKFISSGKMYRAVAWLCVKNKINLNDEDYVLLVAQKNPITFLNSGVVEPVLMVGGTKLQEELYDENIAAATSYVSRLRKLRNFLVEEQRRIGSDGGMIMEGRDITTNVFPDAELKIYLDASPEARAERRVAQLKGKGLEANYDEILGMIKKRDEQDSRREFNPLKRSDDSVYLDSTSISKEEVANKIIELYKATVKNLKK